MYAPRKKSKKEALQKGFFFLFKKPQKERGCEMEIWKDIKDYEGYYQVSNLGNVRRINKKGTEMLKVEKEFIYH